MFSTSFLDSAWSYNIFLYREIRVRRAADTEMSARCIRSLLIEFIL